jgi:hypothetical protein
MNPRVQFVYKNGSYQPEQLNSLRSRASIRSRKELKKLNLKNELVAKIIMI